MKMMWQKQEPDYSTIAISVLAGAAAGLIVGLLMAPKSGEELRSDIGEAVDDYMDAARSKADDLKSSASDLANRGLKEVRKAKDTVTDKVGDLVDGGEKDALKAIDDATTKAEGGIRKGRDAAHNAAASAKSAHA